MHATRYKIMPNTHSSIILQVSRYPLQEKPSTTSYFGFKRDDEKK